MLKCEDCGIDTMRRSNRQKVCPECRAERRRAAKRNIYTPTPPRRYPDRPIVFEFADDGGGTPAPVVSQQTARRRAARVSRGW